MKKIISLLLVLVMCIGVLAACGENKTTTTDNNTNGNTTTTAGSTEPVDMAKALENAKAFIKTMYKDLHNTMTRLDYSLVTAVTVGSNTFDVEWSIEVTAGDEAAVAVGEEADGEVTINILIAKPTEEVKYTLTATISDGEGNSVSTSFIRTIGAVEADNSTVVLTPQTSVETGVAYKWGMYQANLDQTLYFTGTTANFEYYLSTSENAEEAIDIYLEEAEGGYYIYFTNAEGVKTYIDIYVTDTGYTNARLATEPGVVFVWNTEYNTLVATVAETEYYIGTYNTYNTMSASKLSYASTSFPSQIYKAETKEVTIDKVTEPSVNVAYKWGMYQANLDQTLYFAGTTANFEYYLATTEKLAEAVDIYLETAEGGYYIYFTNADGVKTYIDIYVTDTGYTNARLTTEPGVVFVWNTEYNTLVATVAETEYYIGAYNTYNTMSASKLSYASTSFPTNLWIVSGDIADVETAVTYKNVNGKVVLTIDGTTISYTNEYTFMEMSDLTATEVDGVYTIIIENPVGDIKITYSIDENGVLTLTEDGTEYILRVNGEGFEEVKTGEEIATVGPIGDYGGTENWTSAVAGTIVVGGEFTSIEVYTQDGWDNWEDAIATLEATGTIEVTAGVTYVFLNAGEEDVTLTLYAQPTETVADPAADSTLTLEEANKLGLSKENNTYTENKYYVTGEITEVKHETYGNVYIKDANGNTFYIYGLHNADGSTRYDALETKPVVGDTITVYGVIGTYNGNEAQMKNGWITAHTAAAGDNTGDEVTASTTIAAYAEANGWTKATQYSEVKLDDNITVSVFGSAVGGYGQNTGKYYTPSDSNPDATWRVYQSESGYIVISAAEGKTIKSVKVTFNGKYDTDYVTVDGVAYASGDVITVNGSSVTLTVANDEKTNGQAQITAIEVIYA